MIISGEKKIDRVFFILFFYKNIVITFNVTSRFFPRTAATSIESCALIIRRALLYQKRRSSLFIDTRVSQTHVVLTRLIQFDWLRKKGKKKKITGRKLSSMDD